MLCLLYMRVKKMYVLFPKQGFRIGTFRTKMTLQQFYPRFAHLLRMARRHTTSITGKMDAARIPL